LDVGREASSQGVPERESVAKPTPNHGVQATVSSVRSCLAPAVRRA
jgi:hypothetical protein